MFVYACINGPFQQPRGSPTQTHRTAQNCARPLSLKTRPLAPKPTNHKTVKTDRRSLGSGGCHTLAHPIVIVCALAHPSRTSLPKLPSIYMCLSHTPQQKRAIERESKRDIDVVPKGARLYSRLRPPRICQFESNPATAAPATPTTTPLYHIRAVSCSRRPHTAHATGRSIHWTRTRAMATDGSEKNERKKGSVSVMRENNAVSVCSACVRLGVYLCVFVSV